MEFRQTLLAAQKNQQQKSSESLYYKARFDPPKKEVKPKDKLSANIQKFLAKKDEEEKQKKLEAQRKREELLAMRDPKALRKIQKTLKVIKSANKSVLQDAVDHDNTAVTLQGPEQPDQDDYGYESQAAAELYEKMMQKYSKIPDEPKFPIGHTAAKKDLNSTRERVKHALQHEDDPVPHKRRRRTENGERDASPPSRYEPEKKRDEKPEKPKIRKPAPPPMDFNQLLKLAEQKKKEPIEVAAKKAVVENEPERLMTKRQKREYEEEMARRQRRQERIEAEKSGKKIQKDDRPAEKDRKPEPSFGRIPKIGDKANRNDSPKLDKERERHDKEKMQREKERTGREREKEMLEREKERIDREKLDRLKAERDRIEREMQKLNKDRERLEKTQSKLESKTVDRSKPVDRSKLNSREPVKQDAKKSIDLKSQNTYRIDKNSNERKVPIPPNKNGKMLNGHSSQGKPVPKPVNQKDEMKERQLKAGSNGYPKVNGHVKPEDGKCLPEKSGPGKKPMLQAGPSKPNISNSFDFDKHVKALNGGVKRKPIPDDRRKPKRQIDSESEYDSEMDDFIDDGDENLDYSKAIKEIFGYDKSKYRDMDDDDDPSMESSFVQQQREEYISKKHGIMEDLEDMRLEALQKKKAKKKRRLSDD